MKTMISAVILAVLTFPFEADASAEAGETAARETAQPAAEGPKAGTGNAPLAGCAVGLESLVDVYLKAYEEMLAYAREQSGKVTAVLGKEKVLQDRIQKNSAEITQLQFKKTRANKRRAKALNKENKGLWKELKRAKKEREAACKSLRKAASRKVDEVSDALKSGYKEALKEIE